MVEYLFGTRRYNKRVLGVSLIGLSSSASRASLRCSRLVVSARHSLRKMLVDVFLFWADVTKNKSGPRMGAEDNLLPAIVSVSSQSLWPYLCLGQTLFYIWTTCGHGGQVAAANGIVFTARAIVSLGADVLKRRRVIGDSLRLSSIVD